jgi:hypothetical protein
VAELLSGEFCGRPRQFPSRQTILEPGSLTFKPFQHPFQVCESGAPGLHLVEDLSSYDFTIRMPDRLSFGGAGGA